MEHSQHLKIFNSDKSVPSLFISRCTKESGIWGKPCNGYVIHPANGTQILTYDSHNISIWCLNTGSILQTKEFPSSMVNQVYWPKPSRVVASIKKDKSALCEIWSFLVTGDGLKEEALCFTNSQPILAAGMQGELVVTACNIHWRACYLPNGTSSKKQPSFSFTYKWHDRQSVKRSKKGKLSKKTASPHGAILNACVHPNSDHLVTGLASGCILIWWSVLRSFQPGAGQHFSPPTVTQFHWHQSVPRSLVFSDAGTFLFSGGDEGVLVKLDLTGVRGHTLTSQAQSKSVGSTTSGSMLRYFLPHLGSPILHMRPFHSTYLPNDVLQSCGLFNANRTGLYFMIHLQNQAVLLVSGEMRLLQRWCSWTQPPPSIGFLAPVISLPHTVGPNQMLLNGDTGTLQLFDWRREKIVQVIKCNAEQGYVKPHRGEPYSAVEVYHTAIDEDGQCMATVERLCKKESRRDQHCASEVRAVLAAFRPQTLRFFHWNSEHKNFQESSRRFHLDATDTVLDVRFRPGVYQLFLLTRAGSILVYEHILESSIFREVWLPMGHFTLAELGIDLFPDDPQNQLYGTIDFGSFRRSVSSLVDPNVSLDLNKSVLPSSARSPMFLAVGMGHLVACFSLMDKSRVHLVKDSVCRLPSQLASSCDAEKEKARNVRSKKMTSPETSIRRLIWYPGSLHLMVLQAHGQVSILERVRQMSTQASAMTRCSKLRVILNITSRVGFVDAPIEDMAVKKSAALLAFVSKGGKRVNVVKWKTVCNFLIVRQWNTDQQVSQKDYQTEEPVRSVAFITEKEAAYEKAVAHFSVAVVHRDFFKVFSTRDSEPETITKVEPQPVVESRGVKRLQALLHSVEEKKVLKCAENGDSASGPLGQGGWPMAKEVWDAMEQCSSTSSAHPAVWLNRLLQAELQSFVRFRGGQQ